MAYKSLNILNWKHIDLLVFTVVTAFSIAYGQTSVFYILYLFWWSELIRKVVGHIYLKRNSAHYQQRSPTDRMGSFFLLGIYFVFIVVFFGFMANWGNTALMIINIQVLCFKNWFFNINLLWILAESIWVSTRQVGVKLDLSPFSANAIVMHISIVLGGLIMFFIVKRFPDFFTPDNLFGSVLIALPFLLLRLLVELSFKNTEHKLLNALKQ